MAEETKEGRLLNIVHVNVNVTDAERSVEFYRSFGFEVMHVFSDRSEDVGREGVSFTPRTRGAVMSLGNDPRASCKIELLQSLDPPATAKVPQQAGQAGVGRIAIRTKNLLAYVDRLERDGITPLLQPQEIDIVGAQRYALYRDPDGVLLELIEF